MLWQTVFCVCILILHGFGSVLLPSPAPVRSDNLALLTGTLRTYQKASCDGEYMTLRCPTGTTISVQLAQYGKTAPSPALCSINSNTHPELLDIVDGYANSTCHWPTAIQYALLQTVVGLCQKKTSCKFQTSPGTFGGDPCPGSRKYVEVAYKCRPSEFRSVIGCDSEVVQLKCNRSSRLAIYSANYGRTEYESVQCPQPKGVQEESCLSSFATENVMQMCHGKRRCALGVNPATFGTPCKPESKMYLKVINTCVPRKVLKEKYQGELEPDEMFEDETEYESGDPVGGVLEQPSIYSPDHSKGWVNPKSTVKPSFPSKSRSSLKYRQRTSLNQHNDQDKSQVHPSSIAHSSNTLTRHINQQQYNDKDERGQSSGSEFDLRKPFSSTQQISSKSRYNFPEEHYQNRFNSSKRNNGYDGNDNGGMNRSQVIIGGVSSSQNNFKNSVESNHSQDDLRLIYLISQGIRAYDFISRNKESLWLYITISITAALLILVTTIIVKIWLQKSGLRARNPTSLTEISKQSSSAGPITTTALSDIDELSVVTDEVTELPSLRRSPGDELDLQTSSTTHLISNSSHATGSANNNQLMNSGVCSGESAMLLGGGGGGSIMDGGVAMSSTFTTSGNIATLGRKSVNHHYQQQQQQQQHLQHPSSTFISPGGSHYSNHPGANPGSSISIDPIQNPSTMTLGRPMGSHNPGRQRDFQTFYYD